MRVFAIKDDVLTHDRILGYLIYIEVSKAFYVELPDDADVWETPPILSSFAERGEYTVGSYWSRRWVAQRIVPRDRQNIGQILRDNELKEYDEFSMLMLAHGRCVQDDCYLEEISADAVPAWLTRRWETKVVDVVPLAAPRLLVFFRNGVSKTVDMDEIPTPTYLPGNPYAPYTVKQERFDQVEVQPDGYGIYWNDEAAVSHLELFKHGTAVPISLNDFRRYLQNRTVNASEASRILGCSRQNIDDLTRRGKLHPIRTDAKYKLFSKAEVMQRKKI